MGLPAEQQPFDELRELLRMIRSRSRAATEDDAQPLSELYSEAERWIGEAQQRRQRSESIITHARDAVISIDQDGCVIEWNHHAERLMGWSRDEILGQPIADTIIPARYREQHAIGIRRFCETGQGVVIDQRLELTALRRDGSEFPIELTVLSPVRIGNRWVFNAYLRDITRRRQASEAIQASEALYHSLVDRLPINVTRKSIDGRITFVNRPFCDLVNVQPEELIGKTDRDLFPPELAEKYRNDDLQVIEDGHVLHTIEENQTADGLRYFEVWKVPVRDLEGRVVETQAVFWDVTERERTRDELARERDLLRTLMDSLPDLVYVKDTEGRFVTVNKAMLELWGNASPDSIVGKTAFAFAEPHLAEQYTAEDHEVFDSGEPLIDREERVIDRAGQELIYSTSKVPLRDADGKIIGLVGVDRNITNRKRNEEALRESQRAANAANEAKSSFLANMSHEIRTPMSAIIGMTELVLNSDLDPAQRNYLRIVVDSAESLLTIINQILDFSKIEAGRLELESHVFDLRDEIGTVLKSLGIRAHERGLELSWTVDAAVPHFLVGDSSRLRQVLVNLIGNAIKFTEQGEVNVEISLTPDSQPSESVRLVFRVQDTGIGIPLEKQATIFKAFEQADNSTTRRFGGTGLGLSITAHIVEAMGGRLTVDSDPGRGSSFEFTAEFPIATGHPRFFEPVSTTRRPVVIASEHPTQAEHLRRMVAEWGFEPTIARAASEVLTTLCRLNSDNDQPAILVADAELKGVEAVELLARLRSHELLRETPAILLRPTGALTSPADVDPTAPVISLLKPPRYHELREALTAIEAPGGDRSENAEPAPGEQQPQLRVLLVEDGLANRALATGLLRQWGHSVDVAVDGQEAVQKCASNTYDVVLMDVQMPVLDGLEASRIIRGHEAGTGRRVPIVAVTAHAMVGDRERCLQAGMDDYISKPIRQEELQQVLRRVMNTGIQDSTDHAT